MKHYLDFLKHILEHGKKKDDRTKTGTISTFGYQTRYDLSEGFPLLTTKKVFLNPLHTYYRWYSWYVFGYDTSKNDYRMFKVVRMKNISLTKELFQSNDNIADLLSIF